jgi:hypothetical protein
MMKDGERDGEHGLVTKPEKLNTTLITANWSLVLKLLIHRVVLICSFL